MPTIKKVRYFQMKAIQCWVSEKPDMMLQFAQGLQYTTLVPYLQITKEDHELATEDVIEYLRNEDEPFINFTNLKKAATDLWVVFCQAKSQLNR